MILEELNGKKLLRTFTWFYYRNSSCVFEFEEEMSVYIWNANIELLTKYTDLLQFLDKRLLSDHSYTEDFYKKRTALEEYSRQVFGSVEDVYKKYPDIVSVDCTECVWREYYKSKERCGECWALKWNSKDPQILEVIDCV